MRPRRWLVLWGVFALAAAGAAEWLPRPWSALTVGALVLAAGLAAQRLRARAREARARAQGEALPPGGGVPAAGVLEALLGPLAEAVLLLDRQFLVVAANDAAGRLFGRRPEAMRSLSLIRVVQDHHLLQVAREAAVEPREVVLEGGRAVRASAARVQAPVEGVVLAVADLSELRAAQRARSDLVANVSHELRTPIAAALALAETLEGGVPDEEQRRRFHERLTAELERLGRIVERLLHLSRLESATEPFELELLAPGELLATAAARIEPLATEGRRVEVEASEAPPVLADRDRVLEVLANLLDNALRFTPPGGRTSLAASLDDEAVRFEVRDEGPGILPHERLRIFERFYTGEPSRTAWEVRGAGTGLGLAIARHIVSRHGGRIWVGEADRGACVCFTLPLAPAAANAEGEPAGSATEGAP